MIPFTTNLYKFNKNYLLVVLPEPKVEFTGDIFTDHTAKLTQESIDSVHATAEWIKQLKPYTLRPLAKECPDTCTLIVHKSAVDPKTSSFKEGTLWARYLTRYLSWRRESIIKKQEQAFLDYIKTARALQGHNPNVDP